MAEDGFVGAALPGAAFSSLLEAVYPWLRGDGSGVVDRLFKAGLVGALVTDGRVPMGATEPCPGLLPGAP